jgi:hypothetical protein
MARLRIATRRLKSEGLREWRGPLAGSMQAASRSQGAMNRRGPLMAYFIIELPGFCANISAKRSAFERISR